MNGPIYFDKGLRLYPLIPIGKCWGPHKEWLNQVCVLESCLGQCQLVGWGMRIFSVLIKNYKYTYKVVIRSCGHLSKLTVFACQCLCFLSCTQPWEHSGCFCLFLTISRSVVQLPGFKTVLSISLANLFSQKTLPPLIRQHLISLPYVHSIVFTNLEKPN